MIKEKLDQQNKISFLLTQCVWEVGGKEEERSSKNNFLTQKPTTPEGREAFLPKF